MWGKGHIEYCSGVAVHSRSAIKQKQKMLSVLLLCVSLRACLLACVLLGVWRIRVGWKPVRAALITYGTGNIADIGNSCMLSPPLKYFLSFFLLLCHLLLLLLFLFFVFCRCGVACFGWLEKDVYAGGFVYFL